MREYHVRRVSLREGGLDGQKTQLHFSICREISVNFNLKGCIF